MHPARAAALSLAASLSISSLTLATPLPAPYTIQLQARASVGSGATTFNLPAGSSFNSVTPDINNSRHLTFKILTNGATGTQAIWYGQTTAGPFGAGAVVRNATDVNAILSDSTISNNNIVAYPQTSGASGNGIYKYDGNTATGGLHTNGPLGAQSWGNPRFNDSNFLGTRATFSGSANAYVSFDPVPAAAAVHATDVAANSSSPYSFLSTSNFDNSRRIVGRVNIGATFNNANVDEVRLFNSDGSSSLIARDRDGDATSPFFQFDNTQPGLNDIGWAAFISRTTTAAASRSVFISNGTTNTMIAGPGSLTTNGTTITSIDNFSPNVNNLNQVVFRATDSAGVIGVFVGDGATLQRIANIGTTVHTDIGDFPINSFGGNPTINDDGDVAFGGGLGTGGNFIAVALVPEPATLGLIAIGTGAMLLRRKR